MPREREPVLTGNTIPRWTPIVIAILGAGIVWGTTTASLADVSRRVAELEEGRDEEARWRQRVDQRLTAILCHLDPARCLEQR